eukprot:766908-Hanusia_phi.AAC.1
MLRGHKKRGHKKREGEVPTCPPLVPVIAVTSTPPATAEHLRSGAWQGLYMDSTCIIRSQLGWDASESSPTSQWCSFQNNQRLSTCGFSTRTSKSFPVIATTDGVFYDDFLRVLWFLPDCMRSKEMTEMDDFQPLRKFLVITNASGF